MSQPPSPWVAGAATEPPGDDQDEADVEAQEIQDGDITAGTVEADELTALQPSGGGREGSKQPSKAETRDRRSADMLALALNSMTYTKPPKVHDFPAPPALPPAADPTLPHRRAPLMSTVGTRKSYLQLFLNSTSGRFTMFVASAFMVNVSIYGLTACNKPEFRKDGVSFYYTVLSALVFMANYTLPVLAEHAGMSAKETGWKPYLFLYRLSFLIALPACLCQVFGTGAEVASGNAAGPAGKLPLEQLPNDYWNYFELANGFVALNLTKGVTEVRAPLLHGVSPHKRISRFIDAELRINREPFSDQPEPTETPGRLATYRIAPVFAKWAPCTTRYRISTQCLRENPIIAWAVSKSTSLCSRYKSVACKPPKPKLEPVYKCSTDKIKGIEKTDKVEGLCGHVTLSPPEGAVDELSALLLYDAWPKITLPHKDTLWLDVSPDECINNPAACKATWSNLFLVGFICQILVNILILIPCFMDCRLDDKVRKARKWEEENTRKQMYQNIENSQPKKQKGHKKNKPLNA